MHFGLSVPPFGPFADPGVGLGDPAQWDCGFFGKETDAKLRAARMDEALEVLTGLWSGEPFAFAGQHFQLDEVTFLPRPAQARIPICVGRFWPNRPPLRRAARYDGMCPLALLRRGGCHLVDRGRQPVAVRRGLP